MIKKICIIIGARPELIRFSLIIHQLKLNKNVKLSLIHTGQHYSDYMSNRFFQELNIPSPNENLSVGEHNPNEQVGNIILKLGSLIEINRPDVICVWGDTNSSLGAAIAANKNGIKLCHIEAGCRSYDFRMSEEYNRIIIDNLADILFPVSLNDKKNLQKENIHGKSFFLGDPLYDVFLHNQKLILNGSPERSMILVTLHRAENVDNFKTLKNILNALNNIQSHTIVFPIHPRTKKMVKQFDLTHLLHRKNIKLIFPVGYFEMLHLLNNCQAVITDSGGLQKEAFFAKKTCITLRKSTEWIDTVNLGVNILLDPQKNEINKLSEYCRNSIKTNKLFNKIAEMPYGDGTASKKIVNKIIEEI